MRLLSAQLDAYLTGRAVARQRPARQRHGTPPGRRADAAQGTQLLYPVSASGSSSSCRRARDALQKAGAQYHPWPSDRPGERAWRLVTIFDTSVDDVDRFLSLQGRLPAMTHQRTLTAAHWGVYEVEYDDAGKAVRLHPFSKDRILPDRPAHAVRQVTRLRVRRPAVRKSWLDQGPGANRNDAARDPFVEVSCWDGRSISWPASSRA